MGNKALFCETTPAASEGGAGKPQELPVFLARSPPKQRSRNIQKIAPHLSTEEDFAGEFEDCEVQSTLPVAGQEGGMQHPQILNRSNVRNTAPDTGASVHSRFGQFEKEVEIMIDCTSLKEVECSSQFERTMTLQAMATVVEEEVESPRKVICSTPQMPVIGDECLESIASGVYSESDDQESCVIASEGEHKMDTVQHRALEIALTKLKQVRTTARVLRIIEETDFWDEQSVAQHSPIMSIYTPKRLGEAFKEDYSREKRRFDSILTEQNQNQKNDGAAGLSSSMSLQNGVKVEVPFDLGQSFSSQAVEGNEADQFAYLAVHFDEIDAAMALYLSTDVFGQSMRLPIIRLRKGQYVIGLLKYSLRATQNTDSGLQGGVSGVCLTEMLVKVYWKQIEQIEGVEAQEGIPWHEQVGQALEKYGASSEVSESFKKKYVSCLEDAPLEKLLAGRARAVLLREKLRKRDDLYLKRLV